ncbi:hypothetical protein GCM10010329_22960 [Streptomyces spiroverticillatus]|uniref:Uncharacterized protein n=1 Tax=Streptomyces finlayi TaxID=67296 RepID=A0A918WUR7_9ACTN|nr:hypothetical protein [Streptomyces finlayi]GHA00511.1 hypothetical protein GCM10010329_22960 [Streptomyces spiroverticillatus]GHC84984.1 hypothetical protein GCM10010334_15380 [Streptomyces finlayi]
MTSPVPIPPRSTLPPAAQAPDAVSWSSEDARAWRAEGVPWWARPRVVSWGLALFLLAGAVFLVAADTAYVCTEAAPCGTDWAGYLVLAFFVVLPYCCLRLPGVALWLLPAVPVLILTGRPDVTTEDLQADLIGEGLMTAGSLLALVAVIVRLRARRRQRALFLKAAQGRTAPLPKGFGRDGRAVRRLWAATALLVVAGGLLAWGALATSASDARDAKATRTVATVLETVDLDEDDGGTVRVRTADGRERTLSSLYPLEHPVGSRVTVLSDEGPPRLAAEGYDAVGQQMGALPFLVTGVLLLAKGLQLHLARRALRRGEQPVLRVFAAGHFTWQRLYAATDTELTGPAVDCTALAYGELLWVVGEPQEEPDEEGAEGVEGEEGVENDDEEDLGEHPAWCGEAVVYGVLAEGAEIAVLQSCLPLLDLVDLRSPGDPVDAAERENALVVAMTVGGSNSREGANLAAAVVGGLL